MNYKAAQEMKALKNELKRLNACIADFNGMIAKRKNEICELNKGLKNAVANSTKIENKIKALSKHVAIMDTSNAHNGKLVDGINDIFNDEEGSKSLVTILSVLYIRDAAEVEEKLNVKIVEVMEKPLAYASDYLMNVADDVDLECILDFCRYKC